MTVLFDDLTNIAGASELRPIYFYVPKIRENDNSDGIITKTKTEVRAVDGAFTTPDLDAGPAKVVIGSDVYDILIPESSAPVRLWPLIDAGIPTPREPAPGFVRDGGGIARVQAVTAAEYASMTHDPATLYFFEDGS